MKKLIPLAALLLCLLLLASCSPLDTLSDVASQITDKTEKTEEADSGQTAAVSDTLPPAQSEDGEEDSEEDSEPFEQASPAEPEDLPASQTDSEEYEPQSELPVEEVSQDYTDLSAEDCVADAEGTDGKLPYITLDCEGARSINEDIEGTFRYLVDEDYCTLYYDCHKTGRVLSILVAQLYDGDASYYTPYNLDLLTGQQLSGGELLDLLGADREEVALAELEVMANEYEYRYADASLGDGQEFYQEQFDRTVSPDNADTGRLWLEDGRLMFVAKIYSLAGAEFYEYPMDTGLSF